MIYLGMYHNFWTGATGYICTHISTLDYTVFYWIHNLNTIVNWEPEGHYHCWTTFPLRTTRALSPKTLYSDSALLVLNRTSFNSDNALLALNWQLNVNMCDKAILVFNLQKVFCTEVQPDISQICRKIIWHFLSFILMHISHKKKSLYMYWQQHSIGWCIACVDTPPPQHTHTHTHKHTNTHTHCRSHLLYTMCIFAPIIQIFRLEHPCPPPPHSYSIDISTYTNIFFVILESYISSAENQKGAIVV